MEDRRVDSMGMDLYDPETNVLVRHRQSWSLEPRPASGRQKVVGAIIARDADTGEARWAYKADGARRRDLRRDHAKTFSSTWITAASRAKLLVHKGTAKASC